MTLIYAKKIGRDIQINSDTKLSLNSKAKLSIKDAILKSIVLSDTLTLSFSGSYIVACHLIKQIAGRQSPPSLSSLIKDILRIEKSDLEETSFIITALRGSESEIIRIREGVVEKGLSNAYIGDHDAFESYQKAYYSLVNERKDEREWEHQRAAFEHVIENQSISTVGGFNVMINTFNNGFQYTHRVELHNPRKQNIKANTRTTLDMGNAKTGGYSVEYLSSRVDKYVLAIYHEYGSFGLFFHPFHNAKNLILEDISNILKPEIISCNDGLEFTREIQRKYNLIIEGYGLNPPTWKLNNIQILSFGTSTQFDKHKTQKELLSFDILSFELHESQNEYIIDLVLSSGYKTRENQVVHHIETRFSFIVSDYNDRIYLEGGIIQPRSIAEQFSSIAIAMQRGLFYERMRTQYSTEEILPFSYIQLDNFVGYHIIEDSAGYKFISSLST